MATILKTWPAFMTREHTLEVFGHDWGRFYFSIGRGRPKEVLDKLYFTHRGQLLGHFGIGEVVQNAGQLPKLRSLQGEESEWQIKADAWVAICSPPFHRLEEVVYHDSFRGWRYFDLAKHRGTLDAKIRL